MPPRSPRPVLAIGLAPTRRQLTTSTTLTTRPSCPRCRRLDRRAFSATSPLPQKPAAGTSMDPKSSIPGTPIDAPRSYGKRIEGDFTPQPLPRPIGMPLPPRAGENTGIDPRTLRQRREDFVDFDKHMARRRELTAQMSRPYFRDWGNLRFHEGKSFLAPPRLFKAELSLFFPNLNGQTLVKTDKTDKTDKADKADTDTDRRSGEGRDTTPLLLGRASVVSIFSSRWAEMQADSFVSPAANPALHSVLAQSGPDAAQLVRINYEDNAGKALLVRLFMGFLRRRMAEADWARYFLVRRGITDDIRESIGLLNSKVGYTYLVDHHCRIRWAGSGPSQPDERESLAKGLARLVAEIKRDASLPATARERLPGKPHLEKQAPDI